MSEHAETYEADAPEGPDQGVILRDVYFYGLDAVYHALVLTPTCDFEHNKCDFVQSCAIFDAAEVVEALIRGSWAGLGLVDENGVLVPSPLSNGKKKELADRLRALINQQFPRYHWLPPLPGSAVPKIADFQIVQSTSREEIDREATIARLRSPFREQVAARYSAYMGRVGTDNPAVAEVVAWSDNLRAGIFGA